MNIKHYVKVYFTWTANFGLGTFYIKRKAFKEWTINLDWIGSVDPPKILNRIGGLSKKLNRIESVRPRKIGSDR